RGEEENLALLREVREREADVGEEAAGQHVDPLAREELLGHPDGIARAGTIVAGDDLELLAVDAAGRVDLLQRELPALAIGIQERGLCLVAVDLADADRVLRGGGRGCRDAEAGDRRQHHRAHQHPDRAAARTADGTLRNTDGKVRPTCRSGLHAAPLWWWLVLVPGALHPAPPECIHLGRW